jgi:hypothetical protein
MLTSLQSLFSFPLLSKELAERAARPRTYWLRVGAALLLFGGFWFNNDNILKRGALEPSSVLGAGRQMFEATILFIFICIYAFVPAMLCGVVTHEKERDSLVLLLLTRMRPWQIALQKYLGGLIPALTLLFSRCRWWLSLMPMEASQRIRSSPRFSFSSWPLSNWGARPLDVLPFPHNRRGVPRNLLHWGRRSFGNSCSLRNRQ